MDATWIDGSQSIDLLSASKTCHLSLTSVATASCRSFGPPILTMSLRAREPRLRTLLSQCRRLILCRCCRRASRYTRCLPVSRNRLDETIDLHCHSRSRRRECYTTHTDREEIGLAQDVYTLRIQALLVSAGRPTCFNLDSLICQLLLEKPRWLLCEHRLPCRNRLHGSKQWQFRPQTVRILLASKPVTATIIGKQQHP